jgi:hypothetical protein
MKHILRMAYIVPIAIIAVYFVQLGVKETLLFLATVFFIFVAFFIEDVMFWEQME